MAEFKFCINKLELMSEPLDYALLGAEVSGDHIGCSLDKCPVKGCNFTGFARVSTKNPGGLSKRSQLESGLTVWEEVSTSGECTREVNGECDKYKE